MRIFYILILLLPLIIPAALFPFTQLPLPHYSPDGWALLNPFRNKRITWSTTAALSQEGFPIVVTRSRGSNPLHVDIVIPQNGVTTISGKNTGSFQLTTSVANALSALFAPNILVNPAHTSGSE
jgi:hypothetical protein